MNIARLYSDLKKAEGVRLTAYKDSLGLWTAGVGHLLAQDRDWTGQSFSPSQVEGWLEADVGTAVKASNALIEWQALDTDARQNAIVELIFNLGLAHWKPFAQTRHAITIKAWKQAKDGLLDSLWARQVQPHGLDKPGRATRIANQILSGEFQA